MYLVNAICESGRKDFLSITVCMFCRNRKCCDAIEISSLFWLYAFGAVQKSVCNAYRIAAICGLSKKEADRVFCFLGFVRIKDDAPLV